MGSAAVIWSRVPGAAPTRGAAVSATIGPPGDLSPSAVPVDAPGAAWDRFQALRLRCSTRVFGGSPYCLTYCHSNGTGGKFWTSADRNVKIS